MSAPTSQRAITSIASFRPDALFKALLLLAVLALPVALGRAAPAQDDAVRAAGDVPPILAIGAQAPDFALPGIDGRTHHLSDYASSKVLAIVFTCDHCPVAQMYEKRIKQLTANYQNRSVAVVAINPNDPNAIHLSEMGHTDLGDSLAEMKVRAEYRHFNFPYLSDGADQAVALKYGPTATPHVFIFDEQRRLKYQGRIDNNTREELATRHEARDAIEALLAQQPVAVTSTPAVGCSTKWAYKEAGAKAEVDRAAQEPVNLETVSVEQLKALRANAGTGKLLLVNFWATWCEPCKLEMPWFVDLQKKYGPQGLQVLGVAMDDASPKDISDFAHKMGVNYPIVIGREAVGDQYGGIPYLPSTFYISRDGKVVERVYGLVNKSEIEGNIQKALASTGQVAQK